MPPMMRVASIALVLVACGAPTPIPAPRPPTTTPPAATVDAGPQIPLDRDLALLAQRSTRLYQDVVAVFASAGGDCAAATAKLGGLQTTASAMAARRTIERVLTVALRPGCRTRR